MGVLLPSYGRQMSPQRTPKPKKRKLLSFQFAGRPRRALLWKKATYEMWYRYAKVLQTRGGKLPAEFGDLREFSTFEEWWRHPEYGFELFCEPPTGPLVQLVDSQEEPATGTVVVAVTVNADRELILRDFQALLKRINSSEEYRSQARYQPSLPQQQLKLKKLEEALQAFLVSETMLHRRAIRRLYKRGAGERPYYHRVDETFEALGPSTTSGALPTRRLVTRRRLRIDPTRSERFDLWYLRKMRLLSRQRKVVRDVFASIEKGRFP